MRTIGKIGKYIIIAVLLALSFSLAPAVSVIASPGPVVNVNTGEQFDTIQEAIDDSDTLAGHTITVAAGTYVENVNIPTEKDNLKLLGAGVPDTILSPTSGTAINVYSPVTIKGFYILQSDGGTAINVVKSGGVSGTPETPAVIESNKIESPSGSRGDGIKWSDYVSEHWVIKDNELINRKLAIYLNQASHVVISGNTLIGYKEGIGMNWSGDPAHDLMIVDNNFLGTDYPFTPQELLEKAAIMLGEISYNVGIYKNEITGSPNGIRIPDHASGVTNLSNVSINCNNIYDNTNYGITNDVSVFVDAEYNWWGAGNGPSGQGLGSGDAVSTNVDFIPWLSGLWQVTPPCGTPPPPPTPPGEHGAAVGIEVYSVDKIGLIAPWIALAVVIIAGGVVLLMRRRARS